MKRRIHQATTERRGRVCNTEFRLHTKWTCCRFRHQLPIFMLFSAGSILGVIAMVCMVREMGVRPLDLNKAFGTNRLITAPCPVEIRRVVKETDRAFTGIFVEVRLDGLSIHKWVLGKLQFPGR